MKLIIALAALTLCFAPTNAQTAFNVENEFDVHAELFAWPQEASNVAKTNTFVHANYSKAAAIVYKNGGASIFTAKIPQTEISGQTVEVEGGALLCSDPLTGDYLKLNPYTGVSEAKIAGQYFVLLPRDFGTAFAPR